MTLLTLSYKKSKMRAILGSIVYILILSIRRRAIKMTFPKFSRQFFDYFPKLVDTLPNFVDTFLKK